MNWGIVYFIIAIAAAVIGIWNLAQKRNYFLAVACILWFLVILFERIIPQAGIHSLVLIPGINLGNLLFYVIIPGLLIFAFFQSRSNRY